MKYPPPLTSDYKYKYDQHLLASCDSHATAHIVVEPIVPCVVTYRLNGFSCHPPAELPRGREFRRFKDTGGHSEWEEKYRPGRFHPVNLGDTFHDGVYRVIRKLGNGSFSTVWLAVNTRTSRYVALKIMTAKASSSTNELAILDHLSKQARQDSRSQHLMFPLDTFTHQGPNSIHRCMVFEPMSTTAASLAEQLPENRPTFSQRYPKWMAKRILLHALRGLVSLHANGVVHADVEPGNMLFSIGDLGAMNEDDGVGWPESRQRGRRSAAERPTSGSHIYIANAIRVPYRDIAT